MCVITSLFLGLIISAEEIVKDRKILKRESFLNLSWFSYLNSKVMIMFLISAIQTISFILIGNYILEIKGMTLPYWLVLFTTSCFANMLGLNISSAFNSVITIYILIPFIIIPQLLFSGVLVKFDKLHRGSLTSGEFVPVIGDMMAARWSFEALAVEQFKNNRYERDFFKYRMGKSQNYYYASFLIVALQDDLWRTDKYKDSILYRDIIVNNISKLNYYINWLSGIAGINNVPQDLKSPLNINTFDTTIIKATKLYLDRLGSHFLQKFKMYMQLEDSASKSIEDKIGNTGLANLENHYENKQLVNVVLDRGRIDQYTETENKIIQKYEPGYMKPTSKYGRAQLYAPYKQIGHVEIDTFWFDLLVLWIVTLGLYTCLYYNLLQKLIIFKLRFKICV